MRKPRRIVIVGGTHGNEWTGITIVNHYQEYLKKKFPSLTLDFVLANPEAYKLNRRFVDEDLNRAFQYLHEHRESYEHQRARELREFIQQEECLVLDLHTTTSAMGNTVIISDYNPLILSLCAKLTQKHQNFRVIGAPDPTKKYLANQSKFGLILEVGPVANGVVAGAPLESSLDLITSMLEVMAAPDEEFHADLEIYEETQDVHYPRTENGQLNGYIHSEFQGKDFQVINGKFTPFSTFQNLEVTMELGQELYPIFINEAAYYPTGLAFTLCRKKRVSF